jgi:hypothetical protein
MTGVSRADLIVVGMFVRATGVAGDCIADADQALKDNFGMPEAGFVVSFSGILTGWVLPQAARVSSVMRVMRNFFISM